MKKLTLVLITCIFILTACKPVDVTAPAPIYDTGIDPNLWAFIPSGEFYSGQFNLRRTINYDYEMMVTHVTNQKFADYLNTALADGHIHIDGNEVVGYYPGDEFHGGRHEEEVLPGDYIHIPIDDPVLRLDFDGQKFTAQTVWENHPMTMVSWFGAKAYCEYYGWRLPSELEWEKAARGTDTRPFPWGETIARNNANLINSRDPFEDMSSLGSRTTPVGFFNGKTYDSYATLDSASPYGIYDMAGNVWEWTNDVYDLQHYRYLRGGSKDVYENYLRIWIRNSSMPTYTSPGFGFRCVR
ncbi:MAG TPA: SUMF1/EgtB/PvdO family nonheme iron enzyme [Anaerolineaceae bacterium]|nr:SUMF1/EgtB/PvdO family nonheme iron enzyme [Anaerolineaceae bacterium]